MKYIGLDIDGVVLDYVPSFMRYAKSLGVRIGCSPDEVSNYAMTNAFPDLDPDQIKKMIEDFSVTEDFGKLNLYQGVMEVMERFSKYKNVQFIAITNAGVSETTRSLRLRNLRHLPFSEIHVLPLRASKSDILKSLPQNSIYADDLKSHVDTASDLGLQGILFRQSYNVNDDHDHVVNNWQELENKIEELI